MKFLADENVHPLIVRRLRGLGLDVEWIKETSRGAQDEEILSRPDIAKLVLTLDPRFRRPHLPPGAPDSPRNPLQPP